MRSFFLSLVVTGLLGPAILADEIDNNWHRWRGPNGDGTSTTANPPVEWGPDKNVKWKVAVPGKGSATPIIWGDQLFILTAIKTDKQKEGNESAAAESQPERERPAGRAGAGQPGSNQPRRGFGRPGGQRFGGRAGRRGGFGFGDWPGPPPTNYYQFVIICYDRQTGEEQWRKIATEQVPHESGHGTNTFASGSPVTDGERLFVNFGSRGIFCYDLQGNKIWEQDLGEMQTRARFGEGSSPALYGDTLVVPWDHEGPSFVAALDAKTGKVKWKTDRDEPTSWATPLITEYGNKVQVITNGTTVRSYDLETGELLWECGGQASNPIPTPVRQGDVVYCMTGYRGNAVFALPLDATGDITDTDKVVWSRNDAAPYVPSPTLYKGQLYFTKSRDGIMCCLEAETGDVIIPQTRLPGIRSVYASPVAAQDRVYFSSREGTTLVVKHGSSLEVLATNELGETIDASPAMVGNDLFIRTDAHLYCFTEK
jgi:outer membrane protein assembly factor BamB